jgi:hypothetical protein
MGSPELCRPELNSLKGSSSLKLYRHDHRLLRLKGVFGYS